MHIDLFTDAACTQYAFKLTLCTPHNMSINTVTPRYYFDPITNQRVDLLLGAFMSPTNAFLFNSAPSLDDKNAAIRAGWEDTSPIPNSCRDVYLRYGHGKIFYAKNGSRLQVYESLCYFHVGNFSFEMPTYADFPGLASSGVSFLLYENGNFGTFYLIDSSNWGKIGYKYDINTNIQRWIAGDIIEPDSTDPYNPDGETETGGGGGTFDNTSDPIPVPDLPSLSAADTSFITLFNPSPSELRNLAGYMWSTAFNIESFKKLFADPMQTILGLSLVPVVVPNAGSREVTVGNISTGVTMNVAASQYVSLDCGTIKVDEYWGAYLDYAPYTKSYIYLPYIGTHQISTDDIMGKNVNVVYHVDILSGACTAFISCNNSVIYQFTGQVASSIPITGDNFNSVINGALNIAASIGTMVATGGFSAPASVAKLGEAAAGAYTAGHMLGSGASIAQNVASMKPQVEKSGAISGTGGLLSIQTPYLILERPRAALPALQNNYVGYPSYITDKLRNFKGFVQVEEVHLVNIPCTQDEQAEIYSLLKEGVIISEPPI